MRTRKKISSPPRGRLWALRRRRKSRCLMVPVYRCGRSRNANRTDERANLHTKMRTSRKAIEAG